MSEMTKTAPLEADNTITDPAIDDATRNNYNVKSISSERNFGEQASPAVTIQQTSVITLLPKRSTDRGRLKYFKRQKSIDEASLDMESSLASASSAPTATVAASTSSTFTYSDRNNNEKPTRTLTEYNVVNFVDNSSAPSTKPKKIPKSNSQDQVLYDHRLYNHLANGYFSEKGKSKSLDMIEADEEYMTKTHSYPVRFPQYPSYEETEQTARYIKDLHISSPASALYGQSSFPNSPCGSPIDSTLRNSPSSIGPLRRIQQQEGGRYIMSDNPGSIITSQQPTPFAANRSIDSHVVSPLSKSRSHEQQQRLYKFAQKKSYSLNTAPYDVYHEKNMRRILSEENVPENVLISKAMNKHYPHLRRASSYDTFNRFNSNNGAARSPARAAANDIYSRQPVKSTKIMFPEHDNVTDCNSIFTQPMDDEKIHAMNINRIMEKSFAQNHIEMRNPHIQHYSSHSFDEANKITAAKRSDHPTMSKSKSLQSQSSTDKNYTIGPYKYDSQIDNEVAVSVSGLLTLPGSNEKK